MGKQPYTVVSLRGQPDRWVQYVVAGSLLGALALCLGMLFVRLVGLRAFVAYLGLYIAAIGVLFGLLH